MHLAYIHIRLQTQFGHAQYLGMSMYAGYSVVLFGLITLECTQEGNPYTNLYGCTIRRIYLPFIYLLAAQVITNNLADIVGHLTGIIAALTLKYMFLYDFCILPRYSLIKVIDSFLGFITCQLLERFLAYYPATEQILNDFSNKLFTSCIKQAKK